MTFSDGKQDYHFCGDFEATDDAWAELAGTLSLDRPAKEVLLYVQSAPAGVDILLARMSLVEVDLAQHRQQLAEQTDKVRGDARVAFAFWLEAFGFWRPEN